MTSKKQMGNQNNQEESVSTVTAAEQEIKPHAYTNNRPNLHIDLQIHISPESTPEQIEAIFACMAKHLYGVDRS